MDDSTISSAGSGPRHCLLILKDVRYLYSQYLRFFLPVPPPCARLGDALSSLREGTFRFERKHNTSKETQSVFCQLTSGLSETLIIIKSNLTSCVRDYAHDSLASGDWPIALDFVWIEDSYQMLKHISIAIEILNESLERAQNESFAIRTSETVHDIYKRIEEAQSISSHLEALVNGFLHGLTVQSTIRHDDGQDPHRFTSANATYREVGLAIEAKLKSKTQEAIATKPKAEDLLMWKVRHAIYWFSESADDLVTWRLEHGLTVSYNSLPRSHKAWQTIAIIFANTVKAAWLLRDLGCLRAYEKPSFEVKEVVSCTKKKVLALLKSFYQDIFAMPNYHLITEFGDFDIHMLDERRRAQHSASNLISSPSISDPGSVASQTSNSTPPAELEAKCLLELPGDAQSQSMLSKRVASSSQVHESNLSHRTLGVNTSDVSTLGEGLHLTHLEEPNTQHTKEDMANWLRGVELYNLEIETPRASWVGFQQSVSSIDLSPPHNKGYAKCRIRVFKLESGAENSLRMITFRDDLPTDRRVIEPSTAQLVPIYAFVGDRSDASELYLTDSGMQSSLRYKFHCRDSTGTFHPWELYGFQGALMGAYFEGDYSAATVLLHRRGSTRTESERFPRLQVWTDFASASNGPARSDSSAESSNSPSSLISEKEFSALTDRLTANVNDSKIFIFSRNFIYVFYVSDRVSLMRPRQGLLHGTPQKKCVCFVPNKNSGHSSIRVRILKGTRDKPAGIPLDRSGMRFTDQERPNLFEDYQSIEVEFDTEQDTNKFFTHFQEYVAAWKQRCVPTEEFRELQRNRRITVSSTTTFANGKRRRTAP